MISKKYLIGVILCVFFLWNLTLWNNIQQESEEWEQSYLQQEKKILSEIKKQKINQKKKKLEMLNNDFNVQMIDFIINGFIILFSLINVYLYWDRTKIKREIEKELRKFKRKYPIVINFTPPKWIDAVEAGLLVDEYPSEKILDTLFYKRQKEDLISIETKEIKRPLRLSIFKNLPVLYVSYLIGCCIYFFMFITNDLTESDLKTFKMIFLVLLIWSVISIPLAYKKTKKGWPKKTIAFKITDIPSEYPQYEKDIFNDFFTGKKQANIFNVCLIDRNKAKKDLKTYGYEQQRFKKDKDHIAPKITNKTTIIRIALICLWIGISIAYFLGFIINIRILYLLFCSIFMLCCFTPHIQNYTEEGYRLRNYLLWYKKFLTKCELPKRKAIFNEQKEDIDLIVEYTMIFWLTPRIKKKIEHIINLSERNPIILDYKSMLNQKRNESISESEYSDAFKP